MRPLAHRSKTRISFHWQAQIRWRPTNGRQSPTSDRSLSWCSRVLQPCKSRRNVCSVLSLLLLLITMIIRGPTLCAL